MHSRISYVKMKLHVFIACLLQSIGKPCGPGIRHALGIANLVETKSARQLGKCFRKMYQHCKLSSHELSSGCHASGPGDASDVALLAKHKATTIRTYRGKQDTRNSSRAVKVVFNNNSQLIGPYVAFWPCLIQLDLFTTDELLWKYQQKHNIFCNLCEMEIVIPQLEWNYSDEDAIGLATESAKKVNIKHSLMHGLPGGKARICSELNIESDDPMAAFAMWGDSAQFNKTLGITLLIWTMVSGVMRMRFRFCALLARSLCRCGCKGRHTYESIYCVMAWSWSSRSISSIRSFR